jgi:hypothetical protein
MAMAGRGWASDQRSEAYFATGDASIRAGNDINLTAVDTSSLTISV